MESWSFAGQCLASSRYSKGMMLPERLTLNFRQVLGCGEVPDAFLAMSIFGRAGRGEAAPDQRDKLSIGIDVSVNERCTHRPSCSMVRFDPGSTTTTARFGAFSLSFCADLSNRRGISATGKTQSTISSLNRSSRHPSFWPPPVSERR